MSIKTRLINISINPYIIDSRDFCHQQLQPHWGVIQLQATKLAQFGFGKTKIKARVKLERTLGSWLTLPNKLLIVHVYWVGG